MAQPLGFSRLLCGPGTDKARDWSLQTIRSFMAKLETLEGRGWLTVLAYDGEYRAADKQSRDAALYAYEDVFFPDAERATHRLMHCWTLVSTSR
jgi:hypothetical protein